MNSWRWHAAALGLVSVLSGCASQMARMPDLPAVPSAAYRLGTGDELRVMVPGLTTADVFNAVYVVNDRGQLALPLLDNVPAAGLTVPELQEAIATDLTTRKLVKQPTVSVQPMKLRPFYVLGEVKTPGEYPYRAGMSVLSAVSVAGGYTFRARQGEVAITRQVNGRPVVGRASEGEIIQPGDTLRIYEKWF